MGNGHLGLRCYNNGIINRKFKPDDIIPDGFVPGMLLKDSEKTKKHREESLMDKYGVTNVSQIPAVKDKKSKTCLEKYGVEHLTQTEQFKSKTKQTKLERYGDENYNNMEKHCETCVERFGVPYYSMTSEHKKVLGEQNKETGFGTDSFRERMKEKYGVENSAQIPHIARNKKTKFIASDGICLDSSWELLVYEYCLRNNIPIERVVPIEYEYNGSIHTLMVDFKIDGILFEVKGNHLLEGVYDYDGKTPIEVKLDAYKKNHVVLITGSSDIFGKPNSTESNGFKYENKCPNPLIGVDISLFSNPEFPYRKDRPKCFYDVSVMGERSSYEAFRDEKLRWEMIVNRINYSGGFIDSKQILNAMNITRKCKQPSWFSKKFAKHIIETYITSDIIIDPFAGWGARSDASTELGKKYIGSDLNEELVEWHKSLGRNISLCNALEFIYEKDDASLFICPPYTDIEVYFDGQNDCNTNDSGDLLTQCDWLVECIKNCPNCKEYVMVCKVVDDGFDKYIVETKVNKSHFGKNNEYVLLITNEEARKIIKE